MNILKEMTKACPRCGSSGILYTDTNGKFYVNCASCSESIGPYGTIEEAIRHWNEHETEDGV